jgi:sortase A
MNEPTDREAVRRTRSGITLKWAGNLFIVLGLAAVAYSGMVLLRMHLYQAAANDYLQKAPENWLLKKSAILAREGTPIGYLNIPRIGVSAAVLEGVDSRTLKLGLGHIPGTALPGKDGNVALAGHRDTCFRGLREIHKNDEIVLTTLDGSYVYAVNSIRVVSPDDVEILEYTKQATLTLVTCYPFDFIGSAPKRFVVQARRVGG